MTHMHYALGYDLNAQAPVVIAYTLHDDGLQFQVIHSVYQAKSDEQAQKTLRILRAQT